MASAHSPNNTECSGKEPANRGETTTLETQASEHQFSHEAANDRAGCVGVNRHERVLFFGGETKSLRPRPRTGRAPSMAGLGMTTTSTVSAGHCDGRCPAADACPGSAALHRRLSCGGNSEPAEGPVVLEDDERHEPAVQLETWS